MSNKYLEKLAEQGYYAPQKKDDTVGKAVGAAAGAGLGVAAGSAAGQRLATTQKAVQGRVAKGQQIADRGANMTKARAKRIKKTDKFIKSTSNVGVQKTRDPGKYAYNRMANRSAKKRNELRQKVVDTQKQNVSKATSKVGKEKVVNKYVNKATAKAKDRLGRKGAIIGAGVGLVAGTKLMSSGE